MRKAIVGVLIVLVILVGVGTFCTFGTRSHYACIDCGFYFQDRTLFGISKPIQERKKRTDWYDRRIGAPHDHRWAKLSCTTSHNLWNRPTRFSCGLREPYFGDDAWLTGILTRLEPLGLDVPYHKELTHSDAERRMVAALAGQEFDPAWKNEEVWRWWEKAGWPWPARR